MYQTNPTIPAQTANRVCPEQDEGQAQLQVVGIGAHGQRQEHDHASAQQKADPEKPPGALVPGAIGIGAPADGHHGQLDQRAPQKQEDPRIVP